MNTKLLQNQMVNTPDLNSLLDLVKREILIGLNCHAIGTIQSFNSDIQTAQISINYKRTLFNGPVVGQPIYKDYPLLLDCPVIILSGGNGALTFPISQGDTCLVLFNDRDIDNWFSTGQTGPLNTLRLHSLSDGVALVGLNSLRNSLDDYDESRVVLANGGAMVGVGTSLVKISNELTTLKTVLNGLIDVISAIVIQNAVPAGPGPVVLSPASISALTAYKTTIGGLLE